MLQEAVVMEMNQPRFVEDEPEYIIDPEKEAPKALEEFMRVQRMSEKDRHEYLVHEAIDEFRRRRDLLKDRPNNHWLVYSVCKQVSEISELVNGGFKKEPFREQLKTVKGLLRFVSFDVIYEGVAEFHESGWCS